MLKKLRSREVQLVLLAVILAIACTALAASA